MTDRKGILGDVTVDGKALDDWRVFGLPLDQADLDRVRRARPQQDGLLHEADFDLPQLADTFIDMAGWGLGFVWVNVHLLGRHCDLGPQTRLYCPAEWLKKGANRITILDLYAKPGLPVAGVARSDIEEAAGG